MSFISPAFFLFLAATAAIFFAAPQRYRWVVLLAASYVFYWLVGGFAAVALVSFFALTHFVAGRRTYALRREKASKWRRRVPLAICLTVNFALLAFFIFNAQIAPGLGLLLIPGMSFYTFQASGYLIDIYRGKVQPEANIFRLALFLSFFPQLVQGPISRHEEIAADLFAGHDFDWERARRGVQKIIWGFFMKLVVANYAAPFVDAVFTDFWGFGGAVIVFGVFIYSVQIYADFAGGINIALGIAEVFGIKLPENFRQPFFANSLTDFWRRWHISLTRWLRDYLFYPLALSKPLAVVGKFSRRVFGRHLGKILPTSIATFCVYFAMGIWHGAGMHIFVFGFLNGAFISAGLLFEPLIERLRGLTRINGESPGGGKIFAILRTLAIMMFLRFFARAESLLHALQMLRQASRGLRLHELWDGTLLNLQLGLFEFAVLAFGIFVVLARDVLTERGADCRDSINKARAATQVAVLLGLLLSIAVFGVFFGDAAGTEFIYAAH